MDVVIGSETLNTLLTAQQNSIEYATAKEEAQMCLDTKEEYGIITWTDEEVRDSIKAVFNVDLSDEHCISLLNMLEETNTKADGFNYSKLADLYLTHLSEHYPF
jgi:hypothetical protein